MKMTADEIRLVVFVIVALVIGATVKHYRTAAPHVTLPATQATAGSVPAE